MELVRIAGLHRTTVTRLLETLKSEALVHLKDGGVSYALGYEVRRLSEGDGAADWLDQVAASAMPAHLQALPWRAKPRGSGESRPVPLWRTLAADISMRVTALRRG